MHLIGKSDMGKSTLMEHLILDDIDNGHGVAVLDPHGRLVERLLYLIPKRHADKVIYANPGDPDYVLIWNPLRCSGNAQLPGPQLPGPQLPGADPGRVADDIISAFKSFVSGWGDRLEHLLRHAITAVMHLPQASLLDVANLLRKKSPESNVLRKQIVELMDNELARRFWRHDFDRYGQADLSPPQHKLSKLLSSGPVALMLSQPHSAFQFQDVMDSGKILLVNLSTVGSETREILGCFMLSLLHLTALGRDNIADHTRRFHIHCDEAHRFLTDALEDLIAETRKFGVSLTLAHQYMSQFGTRRTDALSSVGSTIIFNVDAKDAQYLGKDLRGKVEVEDLISLQQGEAIVRIGTEVVRVTTHLPLDIPPDNCRNQIITTSRQRYYRPVEEVKRSLRDHDAHKVEFSVLPVDRSSDAIEELEYDVFD